VPDDPFGAGPLSYRRTADDCLLYSWGEDFADNGDWVFWPVSREDK